AYIRKLSFDRRGREAHGRFYLLFGVRAGVAEGLLDRRSVKGNILNRSAFEPPLNLIGNGVTFEALQACCGAPWKRRPNPRMRIEESAQGGQRPCGPSRSKSTLQRRDF